MDYNINKQFPVGQLYVPPIEDFKDVVDHILSNKYHTNNEPLLKKLERELSLYLGVEYVLGVTNATIGLIIALEAVHEKGSIITPRYSFPATMNAICMIGKKVCYCDTLKSSPNLCLESLEDRLIRNNSISTILIPNLWSTLNELDDLKILSNKYNVNLIYDSSQAFSCSYNGKKISTNGNAEVFSFHATKLITAFEGGCITTNNRYLYEKLAHIRSNYGLVGNSFWPKKASNACMSELQAGICLKSLANIKNSIEHNKKIFNLYKKYLKPVNRFKIFDPSSSKIESSYQYMVLILDQNVMEVRDKFKEHLTNLNILARSYFDYDFSIFNDENPFDFPNSINLSKSSICLPIGQRISYQDVAYISETINNFFNSINI